MTACRICGGPLASKDVSGVCAACVVQTGLPKVPPPPRAPHPCLRCGHRVFVRAQVRERTTTIGGDSNDEEAQPLAITYGLGTEFKSFWSSERVPSTSPATREPHGVLEAFVCRACGFVEWYAHDPGSIPIGAAHGTELVEVPGEGPYR